MAAEDDPSRVWTEPVLDGRQAGQSVEELLATFAHRRRPTLAHVDALDEAGWQRLGTHAVFGVLDVAGLLREALTHDEEHLADLERRTADGSSAAG